LLIVALGLSSGEHKELVERRRRMEEHAKVNLNINSECSGTGRMKDVEPRIIVHDPGIRCQWFAAVRAAFREILNPGSLSVFVGDDEHMALLLLSRTPPGARFAPLKV
jgi:hypothetical protein